MAQERIVRIARDNCSDGSGSLGKQPAVGDVAMWEKQRQEIIETRIFYFIIMEILFL
jgi:hypothetical protein